MKQTTHTLPSFDGTPLWVEIYTEQPNPVLDVVLVHGLTGDTSAFHWIIEALLHHSPVPVRCLTFDLRGHGFSGRKLPADSHDLITVITQDLKVVCEREVQRPFILAGQSLFGLVAQKYLALPNRPEPNQTCLITPVLKTPGLSISPNWWFTQLRSASAHWPPHTTKRTPADHLQHLGSFDFSPGRIYSDIKFMGLKSYVLFWMSLFGSPQPDYHILNRDTIHIIYGLKDLIVPAVFQRLHLRHLPKVHQYPLPVNHNAIVNQPNQVAPVLIQIMSLAQSTLKNSTQP